MARALRFQTPEQPPCEVEVGRAKSKLRMLCARLGVLCNESDGPGRSRSTAARASSRGRLSATRPRSCMARRQQVSSGPDGRRDAPAGLLAPRSRWCPETGRQWWPRAVGRSFQEHAFRTGIHHSGAVRYPQPCHRHQRRKDDPRRFLHPDTIARISRLDLRARQVVEGFISGMHRSPFFGH